MLWNPLAGAAPTENTMQRLWIIALVALLACQEAPSQSAAPDGNGASPLALAPPAPDAVYLLRGAPGPWGRAGASREAFDRDVRGCVGVSNDARTSAVPGQGSPAAYASFLDWMVGLGWTRDAPPRPVQVSESATDSKDGASEAQPTQAR